MSVTAWILIGTHLLAAWTGFAVCAILIANSKRRGYVAMDDYNGSEGGQGRSGKAVSEDAWVVVCCFCLLVIIVAVLGTCW